MSVARPGDHNISARPNISETPAQITERLASQMLLIRVTLGLSPIHDVVRAIALLHDEGREAFERLRGEPSAHATDWMKHHLKQVEAAGVQERRSRDFINAS